MASRFVRRVRTSSGAVAVQILDKVGGEVVAVEHVGSAHTDAELALLLAVARERLHPGQGELDLGPLPEAPVRIDDVADWTRRGANDSHDDIQHRTGHDSGEFPLGVTDTGLGERSGGRPRQVAGGGRVVGTSSLLLWEVLLAAYDRLGFDAVGDGAFKALVLGRIVEPTSKADTLRVLEDLGVAAPSLRTVFRSLARCVERDYRDTLAKACLRHSSATLAARASARASMVLYDCTTLYFEAENEDPGEKGLRKVGMSKERRVDPQIQIGLLVDPAGFPLEIHCFEGNKAETRTLIPVLTAFQARHGVTDMVVVADAGMLSAGNLNALEDAGFSFIVGSRITKAPYDLADHFARRGNYFTDGQILESSRVMGTGRHARTRRIVYQYSFKREKRDNRSINGMVERAEKVAAGTRPIKKDRFVTLEGPDATVNWGLVERARQLAGLKGYVTNLTAATMSGSAVIGAYHDLWQVERSFRMAKTDLRARPIFHHQRDSIEAHLTIVFAALAISRHLQDATGLSIKKVVTTLRPARSATIEVNGQRITLDPDVPPAAAELLAALRPRNPGH